MCIDVAFFIEGDTRRVYKEQVAFECINLRRSRMTFRGGVLFEEWDHALAHAARASGHLNEHGRPFNPRSVKAMVES